MATEEGDNIDVPENCEIAEEIDNEAPVQNSENKRNSLVSISPVQETDNTSNNNNDITLDNETKNQLKSFQLISILVDPNLNLGEDQNARITCIEAWELNLYIGTNLGEIIHLYKVDDTLGYIQISKQKFSNSSTKSIKKIIVLPSVSIILVHCGSTISGYMLPELSPANIGKAKEVRGVSIDWNDIRIDKKRNNIIYKAEVDTYGDHFNKVTIYTKKSIKFLKIFKDGIRLHKELQYTDVLEGVQMGSLSVVANSVNYDMIDISKSEKIYLFPISSCDGKLTPMIRYVKKGELLLVCGGANEKDSSMGMSINMNGDVVRSTLPFDSYPTSLEVKYPHVLTCFDNNIIIYSIHDQSKLEDYEINEEYENIKFHICNKIFHITDENMIPKITLAPIVSTMDNQEIERIAIEADNAIKNSVIESNVILYDDSGKFMKILKPISNIDRWLNIFTISTVKNCQENFDKLINELSENKSHFLVILIGLFVLKFKMFDQTFEIWTSYFDILDPRLMIYIVDNASKEIFGSVWMYQVLFDVVDELKGIEKDKETQDFLKLYLNTCLTKNFKNDNELKIKSIEIEILKMSLENEEELESVISEIKFSNNEIIELLLLNKKYFALAKFYAKLKDHRQMLYYWRGLIDGEIKDDEFDKSFKNINISLQFLINYIMTNCVDDQVIVERSSEWLLEKYPRFGLKLVTDKKITKLEMNDIKILSLLKDEPRLKLKYLEYIFEYKNEKQFIGDMILIYSNLIMEACKDEEFKKIIRNAINDYFSMSIPKLTIYKYWNVIKETKLLNYKEIVHNHDKLYQYLNMISKSMKSVMDQKLVLEECERNFVSGCTDSFPLIKAMIKYKIGHYEEVINELITIKDYKSAEYFAISLKLNLLDSAVESINMEIMSTDDTKESMLIIDDTAITSNNDTSLKRQRISEQLLEKIFDVYLLNNETKLIDDFLSKYDLLTDSTSESGSTIEKMDNFISIINKVPDNFPADKLKKFIVNNIIEYNDYNDSLYVKKNLIKLESHRYEKLKKQLIKENL